MEYFLKKCYNSSWRVTIVLIGGFIGLWFSVDKESSNLVGDLIDGQFKDGVETRSYIINNYVETAENFMKAFAEAEIVRDLLNDPENPELIAKAQEYTVNFGKIMGNVEGLYIATPETYIRTHTTEAVVGKVTRTGDSLKELQNNILSKHELTNLGIIKSPGTGNMCISMYYPLFDEKKMCIGYVGGAVYANLLMESLESLEVKGLPNSEYSFLNAATGEYLYNADPELICTVTEDNGYLDLITKLHDKKIDSTGIYEYTDNSGVKQVVAYKYIEDRDWLFLIKDTRSNVYNSLTTIKKVTAISCTILGVFTIALLVVILTIIGRELALISIAITTLGNMDLSADELLLKYSGRKDEIGIVCDAIKVACSNLRKYINEVRVQLSYLAEGELTHVSNMEFEGDFKELQNSLHMIQESLRNSFNEINVVTKELNVGSQSVATASTSLASSAAYANNLIMEINDSIESISKQLSDSAALSTQAKEESTKASDIVLKSKEKMDELNVALVKINDAAASIEGISGELEVIAKQTNILALNALVEASRAGEAGSGFGVVANEIRLLAEKSNQAAKDAAELIQETQRSVQSGLEIGKETTEYLNDVVGQTKVIDENVGQIENNTKLQDEKLSNISERVREISRTVDSTAAMAQESAAASEQLDGQANVLQDNIQKFKI